MAQQSSSVCVLHECKRLLSSRALGLFYNYNGGRAAFSVILLKQTQKYSLQKLTMLRIYDSKIAIIGQFGEFQNQKLWILCYRRSTHTQQPQDVKAASWMRCRASHK